MILVIDTETTGMYDFKSSPDAPHQPRLVQLAMLAVEGDRTVAAISVMIRGVIIPDEAAEVHGITTEIAAACGVPLLASLAFFDDFLTRSNLVIAHNLSFDRAIMWSELIREGFSAYHRDGYCTMHAMTPICRIPGRYGDYKWPKLTEAYRHCFGEDLDGAHDALADARACLRIYRWLENLGEIK